MTLRLTLQVCLLTIFCFTARDADQSLRAEESRHGQAFTEQLSSYFNNYCIDCHGADEQMAGIAVHEIGSQQEMLQQRKAWIRVLRMVQVGAMPPEDIEPRPAAEENAAVAELLNEAIYEFDCQQISDPGHPTIRRLNRVEYNNTIRDLFGVDVKPAEDFPSDDVGEGFDNIGGVLSVSPLLMEKYLSAAEEVTAAVIDTTDYSIPQTWATESARLTATHDNVEDIQGLRFLKAAGELSFEVTVPATARYNIQFDAEAMPQNGLDIDFGLLVDGEEAHVFTIRQFNRPKKFKRGVRLNAGKHRISFEFYGDDEEEDETQKARLGIGRSIVKGPVGKAEPDYPESHRKIVIARPDQQTSAREAASQIVRPLLRRVVRRPVDDSEVERFAQLTESLLSQPEMTWERAVAGTIQAMLVSPEFLFRVEQDPQGDESVRELNDHELAVRLSYFLWSSMPDEELFRLAEDGQLRSPDVLRQQIRRMIQDEKSEALVDNFVSQWLNLRNLEIVQPDRQVFSEFNDNLRQAMLQETAAFFRNIMRQDLSVEQLLTGRTTFVNEQLAAHYGIEGVTGDDFVEVSLEGSPRRGVLTHASVLTLTSYPRRTSPVQRGKWILENLFGDGPPPAPANVPELEDAAEKTEGLSVREQMELHRTNPVCASCHQAMDPLGLGLENFDGIGRWRDTEHGQPVDASGELPGGRKFSGPEELAEILLSRREDFLRTMAEKMLTYATGRGLEYYDKCVIDDCIEHMGQNDNRFSSLVEAIVQSDAFMKRGGIVSRD